MKTPKPLLTLRMVFPLASSLIVLLLGEWIARGTLDADVFTSFIFPNFEAYLLAWLLLFLVWLLLDWVFRFPPLSTLGMAVLGCAPCAVDFYTLQLRGEPFLPWDLAQVSEAAGVASAAGIKIQVSMIVTIVIVLVLVVCSYFLYRGRHKQRWLPRLAGSAATAAALCLLVFGVYLQPAVTQAIGITPDAWMQDRYYRYYGVISGFMTNLSNLEIDKPEDYSEETVNDLLDKVDGSRKFATSPLYSTSYNAVTPKDEQVKQPTIIYVMDESYWDVSELEQYGITFDTDVSKNLHALRQTSAYGRVYSPSFGGGTCDVEFEALTGYSKEFLPAGSKPYQQHITSHMQSLPNYLKTTQGYQTAAIHGYYKRFWSRITAYPNLGLDRFVGLEDMQDPEKKRYEIWKNGLVTDAEMARQIEALYEQMLAENDAPVFLHAVTMQNHTSYTKNNYDDESRVKVLSAPEGIDEETLGALEDFATGVWEADAMLGQLTDYYQKSDRPVILVFWGDHYNPIGSNLSVYTATGYASNDSQDPALHGMPLLIWSNYWQQPVEFGTVGAYEIGPVVSELYGLDRPDFFEYLTQQMQTAYRSRTLGVTIETDGTPTTNDLSDAQQVWFGNHWLWQYDLMFGKEYSLGDAAYRSANQSAAR